MCCRIHSFPSIKRMTAWFIKALVIVLSLSSKTHFKNQEKGSRLCFWTICKKIPTSSNGKLWNLFPINTRQSIKSIILKERSSIKLLSKKRKNRLLKRMKLCLWNMLIPSLTKALWSSVSFTWKNSQVNLVSLLFMGVLILYF